MTSFEQLVQHGAASAWLFIPTAIVLGALHGLEPGHSKTMMAAFIVSIRGTVKQALLLGLSAALSHTAVIWFLAFLGMYFAAKIDVEKSEPYLQLGSGVVILLLAAWTFLRTRRERREEAEHHHGHSHEHEHNHGHGHSHEGEAGGPHGGQLIDTGGHGSIELAIFEENTPPRFRLFFPTPAASPVTNLLPLAQNVSVETVRPDGARQRFDFAAVAANGKDGYLESSALVPEPHEFTAFVQVGHGDHSHTYKVAYREDGHSHDHGGEHHDSEAEYMDAHARAHAADLERRFAGRTVTTPQIVLFGLTGGLMPCPAAFSVLMVCLQLKQYTLGFVAVLAFGIGLAITLMSAGLVAAISLRQASKRFKGLDQWVSSLPYLSVAVMTLIGVIITIVGVRGVLH